MFGGVEWKNGYVGKKSQSGTQIHNGGVGWLEKDQIYSLSASSQEGGGASGVEATGLPEIKSHVYE